jgi:hypothetical protein
MIRGGRAVAKPVSWARGADDHFGRILAAFGGIFVTGSLACGMVADGYRPGRFVIGALICPAGMAVIMYAPRSRYVTCRFPVLLFLSHVAIVNDELGYAREGRGPLSGQSIEDSGSPPRRGLETTTRR